MKNKTEEENYCKTCGSGLCKIKVGKGLTYIRCPQCNTYKLVKEE